MMAFCSACGTQLPDGARFCPACGAAATPATAPAPTADVPPPPTPAPSSPNPALSSSAAPLIDRGGGGGMRFVLPAIIVIAVIVIGFVFLTQRDGARPIASQKDAETSEVQGADRNDDAGDTASEPARDETRTSAAALDSAFASDPQGAAARYDGPIRVTGVIATMVTPGPSPALSLEGRTRFNFMIATFPDGYRERLANLAKGQKVSLSCGGVRSLGGTTILDGCAID